MEFEATLLKSGTPDSNGGVYSKEALRKAVEEYNNRKKSPNDGISHPNGIVEFWDENLEKEINKKMLELLYKHDEEGERMYRTMQPYLNPIDVSNVIDMLKKPTK